MIDRPDPFLISRRGAVLGFLAIPAVVSASTLDQPDLLLGESISLWPGLAEAMPVPAPHEETTGSTTAGQLRSRNLRGIDTPRLIVRRPSKPNGAAMLIMPGGGYRALSIDKEGFEVADWLVARQITAFVLLYRLPGEGWQNRSEVPLADAQRAMRLIRARAPQFSIDPERVGAMGFSAGGHLCADLATRYGFDAYRPQGAIDRLSARPMIATPIYPVISMSAPLAHAGSRAMLLGSDVSAANEIAHSPHRNVTPDTPPFFLAHAEDDGTVPPQNSIVMRDALRAQGVVVETHLFTGGSHGFGLRTPRSEAVNLWPELWARWAQAQGLAVGLDAENA
jgi:acetyl esterase/lipase